MSEDKSQTGAVTPRSTRGKTMDVEAKFRALYMKNMTTKETLEELVAAGVLTREQVDKIIEDRYNEFGY